MARMFSSISPPFRPAASAACRKVSKCSLAWSKDPRAGKRRTSRESNRFTSNNPKKAASNGRLFTFLCSAFLCAQTCLRPGSSMNVVWGGGQAAVDFSQEITEAPQQPEGINIDDMDTNYSDF